MVCFKDLINIWSFTLTFERFDSSKSAFWFLKFLICKTSCVLHLSQGNCVIHLKENHYYFQRLFQSSMKHSPSALCEANTLASLWKGKLLLHRDTKLKLHVYLFKSYFCSHSNWKSAIFCASDLLCSVRNKCCTFESMIFSSVFCLFSGHCTP